MQFEWTIENSWNAFIAPFEVLLLNSIRKYVTVYSLPTIVVYCCLFYFRTVDSKVFTTDRLVLVMASYLCELFVNCRLFYVWDGIHSKARYIRINAQYESLLYFVWLLVLSLLPYK